MRSKLKHYLLCFMLCVVTPCFADSAEAYQHYDDYAEVFDSAIAGAQTEQKALLLVLGATWCHDSDALAEQLGSPEVKAVIDERYHLVTIDVGWLENLYVVLNEIHHPAYFGTPSLLIVDPNSKRLLNRDSVQRWQSAHIESASSLAHYLATFDLDANSFLTPKNLAAIEQFEQQQAHKLYAAYKILGPLLQAEVEGQATPQLDRIWEEVRKYRYRLQIDLSNLHQNGVEDPANLPIYAEFSWQTP